jgi:hypothetical protein
VLVSFIDRTFERLTTRLKRRACGVYPAGVNNCLTHSGAGSRHANFDCLTRPFGVDLDV